MKKIMFHCDWNSSGEDLLNTYKIQTPNCSGVWKDIEGTYDADLADYHVVMDGGKPPSVPWDRVIYFQREEPEIKATKLDWPEELFFQGTYTDQRHHLVSVWRVLKSYDFFKNMEYNPNDKISLVSTITSGKTDISGHKKRIRFLMSLVESYKEIDVYGKFGIENFGMIRSRWKGILQNNSYCKFGGLYPYHYSIAFENSRCYNSVSEKAFDALLSWTMPIYWGCPNISDFLPEGSYHHIEDIDDISSATKKVIKILKNPPTQENVLAMARARELILERYNLWPEIKAIIDGSPISNNIKLGTK